MSDPTLIPMTDTAITEAAARALEQRAQFYAAEAVQAARIVIDVVGPLIEAAALERAAKVAEGMKHSGWIGISAAIRALKEQP